MSGVSVLHDDKISSPEINFKDRRVGSMVFPRDSVHNVCHVDRKDDRG